MIFERKELKKPNFFQRIFGLKRKENAIIEINNLLSEKEVSANKIDDIEGIAFKYGVNLRRYRESLCMIYRQYLEYCLFDKKLSERERDDLKHLKSILSLNDEDIGKLHNEVKGRIYREELDNALEDRRLSDREEEFLEQLRKDLLLSEDIVHKIYEESTTKLLNRFLQDAISDRTLSPEEERELYAISENLGTKIVYDGKTAKVLEKYRLFWHIENGEIPEIEVGINLRRGEKCYYQVHCDWLEERKITTGIAYAGPTMRLKIAKGIYWRAGRLQGKRISEDRWLIIDSGDLFLTNRRLIFMGDRGNKTIRLNRILDFEVFSNGIDIQKDKGKSPFLEFSENTDIFAMILGRAIEEY